MILEWIKSWGVSKVDNELSNYVHFVHSLTKIFKIDFFRFLRKIKRTLIYQRSLMIWVNKFYRFLLMNGNGGIRTLAPLSRPTPLAGAPLQPTWVRFHMAPQVGFEPTTDRLTADSSTTELLRNNLICLATSYSSGT